MQMWPADPTLLGLCGPHIQLNTDQVGYWQTFIWANWVGFKSLGASPSPAHSSNPSIPKEERRWGEGKRGQKKELIRWAMHIYKYREMMDTVYYFTKELTSFLQTFMEAVDFSASPSPTLCLFAHLWIPLAPSCPTFCWIIFFI